MTPEQRKFIRDLIITSPQGTRRINKEEFLRLFPSAVEHRRLASPLLEEAELERNAEDLQCAITVGFTFGFAPEHNRFLCRLLDADWHFSHEDIVSALQGIGLKDDETVNALYKATQRIPTYLDYDASRALAVKAIWALGKIKNSDADKKLRSLAKSHEPILRNEAMNQLRDRQAEGGDLQ